jgi:DME family drug/metabolite transporter
MLGTRGELRVDPLGIALAVGAGASYAVYAVATKRIVTRGAPTAIAALTFSLGALMLLPILWSGELGWLGQWRGALVTLHLGLVPTAAAYSLFTAGLRTVGASTATVLTLGEPVTAAALGILFLGERPSVVATVGMGMVLAGLVVATLDRR